MFDAPRQVVDRQDLMKDWPSKYEDGAKLYCKFLFG